DRLREIHFPAQAVVNGDIVGDTPGVLTVEEQPFLTFCSVGILGLRSLECGYITEQKCSQAHARGSRTSGIDWIKMEIAGADIVVVQTDQVLKRVADVSTEF